MSSITADPQRISVASCHFSKGTFFYLSIFGADIFLWKNGTLNNSAISMPTTLWSKIFRSKTNAWFKTEEEAKAFLRSWQDKQQAPAASHLTATSINKNS
jgi:hypothetical protein